MTTITYNDAGIVRMDIFKNEKVKKKLSIKIYTISELIVSMMLLFIFEDKRILAVFVLILIYSAIWGFGVAYFKLFLKGEFAELKAAFWRRKSRAVK